MKREIFKVKCEQIRDADHAKISLPKMHIEPNDAENIEYTSFSARLFLPVS